VTNKPDAPQTTPEDDAWAKLIAEAEDDCRSIAKRDGVPSEWIETILAKLRGEKASRA
jgi:hypothetical protein